MNLVLDPYWRVLVVEIIIIESERVNCIELRKVIFVKNISYFILKTKIFHSQQNIKKRLLKLIIYLVHSNLILNEAIKKSYD